MAIQYNRHSTHGELGLACQACVMASLVVQHVCVRAFGLAVS